MTDEMKNWKKLEYGYSVNVKFKTIKTNKNNIIYFRLYKS